MEGVITFVGALLVIFGIIYMVFNAFEKYAGVRFSSRWDYSENVKNNKAYGEILAEKQNKLKKSNPALYVKAAENLRKKKYANTYSNLEKEIEKIKRTEPKWTKKEAEKQAKIINEDYLKKVEDAKLKYNIKEFNQDLIKNPKYKEFNETHKKLLRGIKLSSSEIEILKSEKYLEWQKLYYEEKEKHNIVDKMKYLNVIFKSPL